MMIYPDMILLDPVDPLTAFNIMRADVRLTARTRETGLRMGVLPVWRPHTFESAPSGLAGNLAGFVYLRFHRVATARRG